ncbi:MAG: hypothetical protein FD167_1887 [bacterium]|nr:MAG: hypothetical protein FD167_1887 [bacterium]
MICTSRRQLGYNPLSPKELDLWAVDWAKVLRSVPTEYLEECLTIAMENHESGPFASFEVVKAWNGLKEEDQHKMIYQKPMIIGNQPVQGCGKCHGSGWERISEMTNGRVTNAVRRCDCDYSKVVDLSDGIPMPEEFSKARERFLGNCSMPEVEMPRIGAEYWK